MTGFFSAVSAQLLAGVGVLLAGSVLTLAGTTWYQTRQHDRTLFGHPRDESDHGLVGQVAKNSEFRRRRRARTDGGEDDDGRIMTDGGTTAPEMTRIHRQVVGILRGLYRRVRGLAPDVTLPDGPTEASTERNGVLSYAAEWHALEVGAFAGVAYGVTGREEIAGVVAATAFGVREARTGHMRDAKKEVGYTATGFIAGVGLGTLLRVANGGTVDVSRAVDVVARFAGALPL